MPSFRIGGAAVGDGCAPFAIAEAGINHNGDLATALAMVDAAAGAEADAVKFQTFRTEEFLTDREVPYTYRSQGREVTEPMFDMFKRTELDAAEWRAIKERCDERGIAFLSTPVGAEDLDFLVGLGVGAVKMGSDDFTNLPLMREFASRGLPMLVSSGMADGSEMDDAMRALEGAGCSDVCLFLCTSQYPTPAADVNARKLLSMRERFPGAVLGFSDHTRGSTAAAVACACGARVFEKHFTLDHGMPGPDQWFSAEPAELASWVRAVREADEMLGDGALEPTEAERGMGALARRSVTAMSDVGAGEIFDLGNVGLRRPGTGMPPKSLGDVIGRKASRDISAGEQISWGDIA